MSGFLQFDRFAAERGDGLLPQLRELLEARASAAADPRVADIAAAGGHSVQAGPNPRGEIPPFLPGNVVPLEAYLREAPAVRKALKS